MAFQIDFLLVRSTSRNRISRFNCTYVGVCVPPKPMETATISRTGTTPTPFGFVGKWQYQTDNDSGLMLLGHRYYDASVGRFISSDPAKQGTNWYAYCGSNPNTRIDPNGQWFFLLVVALLAIDLMVHSEQPTGEHPHPLPPSEHPPWFSAMVSPVGQAVATIDDPDPVRNPPVMIERGGEVEPSWVNQYGVYIPGPADGVCSRGLGSPE